MLSYRIEGIDNGFRLGTSLPHEFSSSLEDVVNKVFGSLMALPPVYSLYYRVRVNETIKIQKTSLVVEKATNGFFINSESSDVGFTCDVDAIKYLYSRLLGVSTTNVLVDVIETNARMQPEFQPDIDIVGPVEVASFNEPIAEEEEIAQEAEPETFPVTDRTTRTGIFSDDLEEERIVAHKETIGHGRGHRQPTKLVSILDGDPNIYPRPWEKEKLYQPLEKRKLRGNTSIIPDRTKDSIEPIEPIVQEIIVGEDEQRSGHLKPDQKTVEFIEKVATIVNDLDVGVSQPLSKDEKEAAERIARLSPDGAAVMTA